MSIDTITDAEHLGKKLREFGLAVAESLGKEVSLKDKFKTRRDIWENVVCPVLKTLHPYYPQPATIGQYIYPMCLPSTGIPFRVIEEGYESAMKKNGREMDSNITGLLRECKDIYSTVWPHIQQI